MGICFEIMTFYFFPGQTQFLRCHKCYAFLKNYYFFVVLRYIFEFFLFLKKQKTIGTIFIVLYFYSIGDLILL